MFDNSIAAFSATLHLLWNWGAEAVKWPLPLLCMSYSGIVLLGTRRGDPLLGVITAVSPPEGLSC
jgi:hypothetical protein